MIDEKVIKQLREEDILICIRPDVLKETDKYFWSGNLDVSILAGRTNPLEDDDYYSLLHFAKMVAASVPVMEKSEELREIIHNYVVSEVDTIDNEVVKNLDEDSDRGKVLDITDNVLTISFGSKTKGTA